MTKEITQKHKYTVIKGKLCIQHYLLLQQLTFHKKLKNNTRKEYQSYHIKLPKSVKNLLSTNTVFIEKVDDRLLIHTCDGDGFKKIKIQKSRKKNEDIGYQLTIPQKLLKIKEYKHKETYILCQITATDNTDGFIITLELI